MAMGILYPISVYVNRTLREAGKKPAWGMSEKQKRAVRFAEAWAKNEKTIYRINGLNDHAKPGF